MHIERAHRGQVRHCWRVLNTILNTTTVHLGRKSKAIGFCAVICSPREWDSNPPKNVHSTTCRATDGMKVHRKQWENNKQIANRLQRRHKDENKLVWGVLHRGTKGLGSLQNVLLQFS